MIETCWSIFTCFLILTFLTNILLLYIEVHKLVCNIYWRVGVIISKPIVVYTDSSRSTLNQWAGSAEENVGDERYGDRSAGNSYLVTSIRGRYRHLDLGIQFRIEHTRMKEWVAPRLFIALVVLFLLLLSFISQPPNWYIPEVLQTWENTW